jgi:hypothetical protein
MRSAVWRKHARLAGVTGLAEGELGGNAGVVFKAVAADLHDTTSGLHWRKVEKRFDHGFARIEHG